LSIVGNVVRLDASGTIDAPPLSSLTELLDTALDRTFEVQLTWLKRQSVSDQVPTPTPDEVLAGRVDAVTREWAAAQGVGVLSTSFDGAEAIVETVGPVAPDASGLVAALTALLEPDDRVTVLFVQRLDITTTTTLPG
jgi:hypothetical protein